MRVFILTIFAAVAALAQDTTANTLVTSKHTPTADAPVFGTQAYFKRVWNTPAPKIELKSPVRLNDYVKDGKFEFPCEIIWISFWQTTRISRFSAFRWSSPETRSFVAIRSSTHWSRLASQRRAGRHRQATLSRAQAS